MIVTMLHWLIKELINGILQILLLLISWLHFLASSSWLCQHLVPVFSCLWNGRECPSSTPHNEFRRSAQVKYNTPKLGKNSFCWAFNFYTCEGWKMKCAVLYWEIKWVIKLQNIFFTKLCLYFVLFCLLWLNYNNCSVFYANEIVFTPY